MLDHIHHADIFDLCAELPPASVDMILCDLPYGTTALAWDTVIPFEPMWTAFKRVIKPRGAIVLTASQPFTSALVMSNPKMFKYEWVWDKHQIGGFLYANQRPLKRHENVLIFCASGAPYFPVMDTGKAYTNSARTIPSSIASAHLKLTTVNLGERYPTSIIDDFPSIQARIHPTQKPVALFEYLIRTYTQEGETVFDPCSGSGTTAIAARKINRHFICGDSDLGYVEDSRKRLADTDPYQDKVSEKVTQHSLFSGGG